MALDHSHRCHVWAPLPGPNSSLMALLDDLPPIMQTLQQAYTSASLASLPAKPTAPVRVEPYSPNPNPEPLRP